jgi:hypothetical protein
VNPSNELVQNEPDKAYNLTYLLVVWPGSGADNEWIRFATNTNIAA